jgi:hypothetical protein
MATMETMAETLFLTATQPQVEVVEWEAVARWEPEALRF